MKILLLGANSYVGARLFFDLRREHSVTGTYATHPLAESFIHLDITDPTETSHVITESHADVVIHAANNASAKWCDANPQKAVALNQTATETIAMQVKKIGGRLIYISSMSAIDETVYGKTKTASERIIKTSGIPYLILRPSLVLGYSPNTVNDRPFNRILKNLDAHTPATYDTSWKFQPTYLHHISEVIRACIAKNIRNETIAISTPETTSRFQSASDILRPFGVSATPLATKDQAFSDYVDPLMELHKYHLPRYSYDRMIEAIHGEIRNRSQYRL